MCVKRNEEMENSTMGTQLVGYENICGADGGGALLLKCPVCLLGAGSVYEI